MTLLNLNFSVPNPEPNLQLNSSNVDIESNNEDNFESEVPLTEQEMWLKDVKLARAEWNLLHPAPPESESESESVSSIIDDKAEYNKTLITLKAEWKQAVHNKKMILYKLDSEIAEAKLKLNFHINSKRI